MWKNPRITINTKSLFITCVISTLLYENKSWTIYAAQKRTINVFHTRSLRICLGYHGRAVQQTRLWCLVAKYQKRSRCLVNADWLGYVQQTEDGRISK